MPRAVTDAAVQQIYREHTLTHDLVYMDLPEEQIFLALNSPHDLDFKRETGPLIDNVDRTWDAVGGAVVPGTVEEGTDLDGQGQEMNLVAIDPTMELAHKFLCYRLFNRDFQHWRIWYHEAGSSAGDVAASYLMMHGKMNGAVEVRDVEDERFEPGTITITFRVTSPIAMLDVVRNIQTNLRSHQRWFPEDLGMEHVQTMQNKKIWWGVEEPD